MTRKHKARIDNVSQEKHSDYFENITGEEKKVRMDADERYLTYILLQQSEKLHVKLKRNIHNDYTTGDDRYPKTRQNTLHLLTQYTNPTTPINGE